MAFALCATSEALAQANLPAETRRRAGVVFATAIAGTERMEVAFLNRRLRAPDAFRFSTVAEAIAGHYGLAGPNLTVTTGCTAGLDAFGVAYDQIRAARMDCVIAGAADAPLTPIVVTSFDRIGAISRRNHDPQVASRPFDVGRDGFVLGEGAAVFVLEEWGHAQARGAGVLAEVLGWSSVSSAFHMTGMRTNGTDIARAMLRAIQNSGLHRDDIDLIDLHGTSTPMNDLSEAAAVSEVFGLRANMIPVTAQKSVMGHALGASNALEIAGAILALSEQVVPPIANLANLDPKCPVRPVREAPMPCKLTVALKVSSGFSGIHSALVLRLGRRNEA